MLNTLLKIPDFYMEARKSGRKNSCILGFLIKNDVQRVVDHYKFTP